jgi:hypothetical protein
VWLYINFYQSCGVYSGATKQAIFKAGQLLEEKIFGVEE